MVSDRDPHVPGDPQEQMEKMTSLARGPKGERGEAGQKGARGLPRGQAQAIVYLFLFAAAGVVACLFWINHQVHAEQGSQQHQGEQIELKLCRVFGKIAALQPPPGNPVLNPARGYDQQLHGLLSQVGPILECPPKE